MNIINDYTNAIRKNADYLDFEHIQLSGEQGNFYILPVLTLIEETGTDMTSKGWSEALRKSSTLIEVKVIMIVLKCRCLAKSRLIPRVKEFVHILPYLWRAWNITRKTR